MQDVEKGEVEVNLGESSEFSGTGKEKEQRSSTSTTPRMAKA
jgi:hypothetical protein